MLIYKFTHLPSGRVYIGALKDDGRWETYRSSSRIVKPLMDSNPNEWKREILEQMGSDWAWDEVVYLEQCYIKASVLKFGWDFHFNQIANTGTAAMFSPEAREKIKYALSQPETRQKMSASNNAWRTERPEIWVENRKKAALSQRAPEKRLQASQISKNFYDNHPDARKRLKDFWSAWELNNPQKVAARKSKISEILKSEDQRKRASEQVKNLWEDPVYREKVSNSHVGKHVGEKNATYKGVIYAVSMDDPAIILELKGAQDIEKHGFSSKSVYGCLSGDRKSHQGYLFTREKLSTTNSYEYVALHGAGTRRRKKNQRLEYSCQKSH